MKSITMRVWGLWSLVILSAATASAGVGTWKNFTSMKDVRAVARTGNAFWAATSGGLFRWLMGSDQIQAYTTADGLQQVDLTAVAIDANGDVWTGTSSGVIHVLSPASGTVRIISDIADAKDQTDKRINQISVFGDTVLICTDFGLSVFRISRFEFGDTYSRFSTIPAGIRIAVLSASIFDGKLWASITDGQTNNRVAVASLSNPNLLPPSSWSLQIVGSPGNVPRHLEPFSGRLYCGTPAGLFSFNGSAWDSTTALAGQAILDLSSSGTALSACTASRVYAVDAQRNVSTIGETLPYPATSITENPSGEPIVGSTGGGVLSFGSSWTAHLPNGPNANQFASIAVSPDGVVWGGSGPANGKGFYRYDGTTWKSFTTSNSPLTANEVYRMSIAPDGSMWASTWGRGIVEIPLGKDVLDSAHVFGENVGMSGIGSSPSPLFIVTSNAAFDSRGNTWMTIIQPNNQRALAVHRTDGTWLTMPAIFEGTRLVNLTDGLVDRALAVDAFDNLWSVVKDGPYRGIISFNNGGRIDSIAAIRLSSANGLPSDDIRTIVVDRENNLWVGTDRGIAIILDPSNPTSSNAIAKYKPLNGLVVNTIAVDPLNQKWVGTSEGVIVLSPDGTQVVDSYSVETTGGKLIDDGVKSIAVDARTGTVYFGTNNGLASLSTAAVAPKTSFDELRIFPNPYIIPNPTQLTVDGLVENSSIRILTIDGRLVRDLKTPGGRIGFWDGKDNDGRTVSSGVYVVVGYSEDGTTVANGKVAVIRK